MYDSAIALWYCQLIWYLIWINITECWLACMYVCVTYWNSVLSLCLWLWLWLWLFLLISFNVIPYQVVSYSVLHQNRKTALIWAAGGGHTETVTLLLDRGADIIHKDRVSYCDACMKMFCTSIMSVDMDALVPCRECLHFLFAIDERFWVVLV